MPARGKEEAATKEKKQKKSAANTSFKDVDASTSVPCFHRRSRHRQR
jgi:hypothetical protein